MKSCLMITGATGGLGSVFARDCARRGYDLFLTDLHDDGVDFAAAIAAQYGVEVCYRPCDLTSPQQRAAFYESLHRDGLRFWGLVNVAGIDHEGGFLQKSSGELLQIVRLNMESTLDTTHAILKLRDPERRFMLINVSSLAAFFPMPYKATYAASKRFLLDMSLALREEIRPFGSVTALCPAGLPTTPDCMRRIFAQGFWGKMTTVNTDVAARSTMDAALRGKAVHIPGLINVILQGLASLVPVGVVVRLIGKRWAGTQRSMLEQGLIS
jgi:hypothetical protein